MGFFQFIKPGTKVDFMGARRVAISVSLALILLGLGAMAYNKMSTGRLFNYGVDFAGGTVVQLRFEKKADLDRLRNALKKAGLKDVVIQDFGSPMEVLIRMEKSSGSLKGLQDQVTEAVEKYYPDNPFEVRRVEMVGPKVGRELKEKGIEAIIYALIGILLYISWRFEFRFALGAVVALFHDVTITAGVFALLRKQVDLQILAALLTIVGYSLNDTIVVYDRIRENMAMRRGEGFVPLVNRSINETLSRTILTSLTTFLAVAALWVLGSEVIKGFAFAMMIGIIVGTYSSIFIASPLVVWWEELRRERKLSTKGVG
ncbi:MAG TPA: protein translocase subunit SecF [Thermosulfidibacter takaii]|uniref:Protein-export membrane protein SecF n=1 Tax=Thermosulfidibacter takaii TaxID=412593 RepID=A0A7C0U5V2_9BACT|nr:protein translocase subunit SecF [Thermosulfidibacter takaii]